LFVAGSSGVQGEWPKILLTRARDGLLYLDHSLPDAEAVEHFVVGFGRGPDVRLAQILRQEAPYMDIAAQLGLRVHRPLVLRQRALFIPRFDRCIVNGRLVRLAQERIAILPGRLGFGPAVTHDEVCAMLTRVCTDPQAEALEYIKPDVANLALGNKDNHARNKAIQRDFEGRIALTPLFDFAPMYLHPDGIARRTRWDDNDAGDPNWQRVVDAVCQKTPTMKRQELVVGLRDMASRPAGLARHGVQWGMDEEVHAHLLPRIRRQSEGLAALRQRFQMDKRFKTLPLPRQLALRKRAVEEVLSNPQWTPDEAIRHLRRTLRLTTREFAHLAGIANRTLQNIEAGRSPGTVHTYDESSARNPRPASRCHASQPCRKRGRIAHSKVPPVSAATRVDER
jgi:DNA-binding XRE family transcriptional regulator